MQHNMTALQRHSVVDFVPLLKACYLHSVPHGGIVETDIPPEQLHLYEDMVERGLMTITYRYDELGVYCITQVGATLIPPVDLHECVTVTTIQWLELRDTSNVRPIFHGPFFCKVK